MKLDEYRWYYKPRLPKGVSNLLCVDKDMRGQWIDSRSDYKSEWRTYSADYIQTHIRIGYNPIPSTQAEKILKKK